LRVGVSGPVSFIFGAGAPLGTPFSRHAGAPRLSSHARRWKSSGEAGHADLDPGTGDADGADEQPHAVLLFVEHVLDRRAHCRAPGIGSGDVLGHRPTQHALLVDVAFEHAPLGERLILFQAIGGLAHTLEPAFCLLMSSGCRAP